MICLCHSWTSGVIRLLCKLLDSWLNKEVSIGLIRHKEVTSKTSEISPLLELWIIQVEAETIFQTVSRGNSSFSTWFCRCLLKLFTVLLSDSSSEFNQRAQVSQMKSKKLLKTWHQLRLSYGNLWRNSCFLHQLSSIICLTCVSWPELSKEFYKSKKKASWRLTEFEISNPNFTWLDCGDMSVNVCSVINSLTTKTRILFSTLFMTFRLKALEWKAKSTINSAEISISSLLTSWLLMKEMKKEPSCPLDPELMKPSQIFKSSEREPTNVWKTSTANLKTLKN